MNPESLRQAWKMQANGLFVPNGVQSEKDAERPTTRIDLVSLVISAVPLLVSLVALSLMEDPTILRVLLWRGNLVALSIAMAQPFLPILVGLAILIVADRFIRPQRLRMAAIPACLVAAVLFTFVPLSAAITESGLVIATLFSLRLIKPTSSVPSSRMRLPMKRWIRVRTALLIAAILSVIAGAVGFVAWTKGSLSVSALVAPRTLWALPREVAVDRQGEVLVYYLVASDDHFTTVVWGQPKSVLYLRTEDIMVRSPCRNFDTGVGQSLYGLVTHDLGGTAYCGPLASCLESVGQPAKRYERDIVDECVIESTHRL